MGSWGLGPVDNDRALDLIGGIAELPPDRRAAALRDALVADPYANAEELLAAAWLIAVLHGAQPRAGADVGKYVEALASASAWVGPLPSRRDALAAVARVRGGQSELRHRILEQGPAVHDAWVQQIDNLTKAIRESSSRWVWEAGTDTDPGGDALKSEPLDPEFLPRRREETYRWDYEPVAVVRLPLTGDVSRARKWLRVDKGLNARFFKVKGRDDYPDCAILIVRAFGGQTPADFERLNSGLDGLQDRFGAEVIGRDPATARWATDLQLRGL